MNTCSNCKWWREHFSIEVVSVLIRRDGPVQNSGERWLGYCEPERHAGNPHPITVVSRHHCGLTAEDYSCGEHKERDDD